MGTRVVDLAVVRSFRFATTQRLEARIEAFNAFNWFRPGEVNVNPTTNQSPVTNLSSPLLAGICWRAIRESCSSR